MSASESNDRILLEARHVTQVFTTVSHRPARRRALVHAVSDVSFVLEFGGALGLVGETGSGKSTLARALLQAPRPSSGSVILRGVDLTRLRGRRLLEQRRHMQIIFQDPFGSFDPKWRVAQIVEEPLIGYRVGGKSLRNAKVAHVLELVGLPMAEFGRRRPDELSGGQCQRVAIARALVLDPALIVCDEALSALDALVQAQVLALFARLRAELGLAYLLISHDLRAVEQATDRVAVLNRGSLCEIGPTRRVFDRPAHPYTWDLLAADCMPHRPVFAPPARPALQRPVAEPPSPLGPPSGCRFSAHCSRAQERCAFEVPALHPVRNGHLVACHFPLAAPEGATCSSAPATGPSSRSTSPTRA